MTAKEISKVLVLVLAVVAAITATGLIAGYAMQPWIICYWLVLTAKNLVDYVGGAKSGCEQATAETARTGTDTDMERAGKVQTGAVTATERNHGEGFG